MILRLFVVVSVLFLSFDQPRLVKTKIADGISASLPKGWLPMTEQDFIERYPSVRAPIAAFTNDERTADFSVNRSATQWPDADLELAKKFFKASLMNMFDRVEFSAEGVREVNGKKFVYFEFEYRINGSKGDEGTLDPVLRYTQMQLLVEPKRTLVFTFNCPRRLRPEWEATALAMMKSLKVH
jgi:hypothetical protein